MTTLKPRTRVFIDQYLHVHRARSVKDLREQLGGRVSKMYRDLPSGDVVHVGYVIGDYWCEEYAPVLRDA